MATPVLTNLAPNQGPLAGGNTAALTGSHFTGTTAVKFGPNSALFTVNSDTQITIRAVPAGGSPGTVNVTVTTPGGTSNAVSYTYVAVPMLTTVVPGQGPLAGGNTVVLTGSHFTGATAVKFGPNSASFTVVSDTSVTATVPAGTGTVNVTVTTPGGTSNAVSYTYVAVPMLTGLDPDQGPLAGGNTVTLTGTHLSDATAVSFGSSPAASFTVVSDTSVTATVPAGTGTVNVTVTTPGGVSSAVGYTYLAVPVLFNAVPNEGPLTGGNSATLTGSALTTAEVITFGSSLASFIVVSDGTIVATAPAGTGAVQIIVTTCGGVSNALVYTYVGS